MVFDLLIYGATVIDGTGRPAVPADLAVRDGRIAAIVPPGSLDRASARTTLDATGLLLTPGFIDIHTHSDRSILLNPRMESKLRQGVTTEVGGNCGSSVAPALGGAARAGRETAAEGVPATWPSMAAYLDEVARTGIAGNYATWVGHGALRASVVGYAMRLPTAEELARMTALLRESLEAGAFGLSTGLIYVPSGYATTDELIALAAVVREYGGVYASHLRNESDRLLEAVDEAITIGRRAGVPVQIAHHKASQPPNWGRVNQSLAMMDQARAEGIDVACDQYPYTASSTGLSSVLPSWALEGGSDALVARLRDPALRARLREEMLAQRPDWGASGDESGWQRVQIARARHSPELEGRRLGEIAAERGQDPFDLCFDLLIAAGGTVGCVFFSMCEDDVQTVLRWPHTMIGSDASSLAPYGTLGGGRPHPRAYGTFPRVLGRYVRERQLLSWEEAIRKMTSLPAARLGLRDRGVLREGAWADLVVLDPATVADRATFEEPHRYPTGILHVFVNGVQTIRHGEHTGAAAGQVLRRG